MAYNAVVRDLERTSARRKAEIDAILAAEYKGTSPADAALEVVDDTFCMEGRPVSGFYRRKPAHTRRREANRRAYYERIDDHPHPWRIVQNARGHWWFSIEGGQQLQYTIAFKAACPSAVPPPTGWIPYSADAMDHVMLLGGDLRVERKKEDEPEMENKKEPASEVALDEIVLVW